MDHPLKPRGERRMLPRRHAPHYRKIHVCPVTGSLPSAESRALGKATICRVPNNMHSANNWHSAEYLFAECRPVGTRQRHTLPSAGQLTLGKYRHVHRTHLQTPADDRYGGGCFCLPSAPQSTLGKLCHVPRTRRCHERSHFSTAVTVIVCRVPAR